MGVEVKTKLTLDDNASSALGSLRQAFSELHASSEQAQEGFSTMKMVAAEFITGAIETGIEKVKEFGSELEQTAIQGQQFEQRIAGLTTAVQGIPWSDAKEGAKDFLEQVQDVAINTRQPIADVEAGFARLVEIQGATPKGLEESRKQIEQMSRVANVLGTSVETIGSQFAFMEEGSLKVKSQMFQLLQPTGIFEHQGMKATEYWSKLSNDTRATLLAKGLDQLAGKMQVATPTFKDAIVQMDNAWDRIKEQVGTPFIEAFTPKIERLTHFLLANSKQIDHYAENLGVNVGHWVDEAADKIKDGFDFIQANEQEIADDIKEAWAFAKEVMEFIIRHKEALAFAGAAKMVGGSELAKGAVGAVSGIAKLGSGGTAVAGIEAAGMAGGALALGAFTAAVGASVLALQQWDDLMAHTSGGKSENQIDFSAVKDRFEEMIKAPDMSQWGSRELEQFDRMRANLVRLAEATGEDARAAGELADRAFEAHHASESIVAPLKAAADAFDSLLISSGQMDAGGAVEKISDGFMQASQAHNEAAMAYIGNILAGDSALQTAFLNSSNLTAAGFAELASHIGDSAEEFRNKLMSLSSATDGKAKEIKPTINMNGGQSFKIQQDFRDQDADRVAIVFRQDIKRVVENRIQAVTSTPFGG